MTDLVHIFLSLPLYVVILLGALALFAFRAAGGTALWRLRRVFAAAAIMVYLGSIPAVSNRAAGLLESRYSTPSVERGEDLSQDIIVVVTGGWFRYDGEGYQARIGNDGWERLDAAVRLHEKIGGRLLFSGAPSPDGGPSIASVMADVARRNGVPDRDILIEGQSRNTYENIVYSKQLIGAQKSRVWLVTSAFRMARAMAVARKQGLDAIAYPCDFHSSPGTTWRSWIPTNDSPLSLEDTLHEVLGLMAYRLRGWA